MERIPNLENPRAFNIIWNSTHQLFGFHLFRVLLSWLPSLSFPWGMTRSPSNTKLTMLVFAPTIDRHRRVSLSGNDWR